MSKAIFTGHLYVNGRFMRATVTEKDGETEIKPGLESEAKFRGTAIPELVNSHTHLGDSFVNEEPPLNLKDSVGPHGFKHTKLEKASLEEITAGMRKSLDVAWKTGTGVLFDFREGGKSGALALKNAAKGKKVKVKVLGRPVNYDEAVQIIEQVDGFGMSSMADHNNELLSKLSELARYRRKVFAIHFSERDREDVDRLIDLKPTFVVHGIHCRPDDLMKLKNEGIPVCITPRSNLFYGLTTDYSSFFRSGISLCIGTDNGMAVPPDMFSEMASLYLLQRVKNRISPEEIIHAALGYPLRPPGTAIQETMRKRYVILEGEPLTPYEIVMKGYTKRKRHAYIT